MLAKRTKIKKKADQVVGADDQGEDQEEKVSCKPEICLNYSMLRSVPFCSRMVKSEDLATRRKKSKTPSTTKR